MRSRRNATHASSMSKSSNPIAQGSPASSPVPTVRFEASNRINDSDQEPQNGVEATPTTEHPPRAPLMFQVSVVGHRPDSKKRSDPDIPALREITRKLLLHIQDTFAGVATAQSELFLHLPRRKDGKPSGLRLISSLAEGADQWVAAEAIEIGYELQVVFPFERTEYEKDFDSNILLEHRRLRDLATAVFELDGCRSRAEESYLAAGRVMLNQTDLLIALWDGKDAWGAGGTGQIVQEALQRGIPTIWVDWASPRNWHIKRPAWRLLRQSIDLKGDLRLLADQVMELLLPPNSNNSKDTPAARDLRESYFEERHRSWTLLGGWWEFFRNLVRGKLTLPKLRVPDFISTTQEDWDQEIARQNDDKQGRLATAVIKWIEGSYLSHYAWANQLSIYYANHYRSSFIWIYLLGSLAVFLALIATTVHASHVVELACIAAEVVVICIIIGLTWYGGRRRWHQRWIDYRTLAEQLRLARFASLLGRVRHQPVVPEHLATYGNPAATWMHWHAQAIQRAAGMPNIALSSQYLSSCRALLLETLIAGQQNYHDENANRLAVMDHRMQRLGELLFVVTLAACAVHFVVGLSSNGIGGASETWNRWLIFCAAFLPAVGAAMAAIRSQGEFQRVVQRSRAMRDELERLRQAVANIPTRANELNSQLLQQAAEQAARLMYNEVLDWRIVFQDRPLVWPA